MGILVASNVGCGRTYLLDNYKGKAKLNFFDDSEIDSEKLLKDIDESDITFINADEKTLERLMEIGVDFDLFYLSKERRLEFLENQVRKRQDVKLIQEYDRAFDSIVDYIESYGERNKEHCYLHKMTEKGHYIGNDQSIVEYLGSLQK